MAVKYYDMTMEMAQGMLLYPGDPPFSAVDRDRISGGDLCNLSVLSFGSHTGTHIDAPKHFFDKGMAVDELDLDYFIGKARVIEIENPVSVTADELEKHRIGHGERLLIKTRNSQLLEEGTFYEDFCYLEPDAVDFLAGLKIKTLGFDYLTVEKYGSEIPYAHVRLLGQNIVLVEGLRLKNIRQGFYDMYILPLRLRGGNGSPVRAVLAESV